MKRVKNILLICAFLMIQAGIMNGQQVTVSADSSAVGAQDGKAKVQKQEESQNQGQAQNKSQSNAQSQKGNANGVKKVNSARPDWSKARGARPASVERPSGSRIPKGAGKPGGAKGPGRK